MNVFKGWSSHYSDHKVVALRTFGDRKIIATKTTIPDVGRTDLILLQGLLIDVPIETTFESVGVTF